MKESFFIVIKSFLDRLLITISYLTVNEIKIVIETYVSVLSWSNPRLFFHHIFMLPCIVVLLQKLKYPKTFVPIIAIYTADSITQNIPFLKEPTSYFIFPSILMYMSMIAAGIFFIEKYLEQIKGNEALKNSIQNFLILYTITGIIKLFEKTDTSKILEISSIIYVTIPSEKKQVITAYIQNEEYNHIMYQILETLSIRGVIIALNNFLRYFSKTSSQISLIFSQYVLIILNPFRINKKAVQCTDFLVFSCAQNINVYLTQYVSDIVVSGIFVSLFFFLTMSDLCMQHNCTILRFGTSFSLTNYISKYLSFISIKEEKILIHIIILILLSVLSEHFNQIISDKKIKIEKKDIRVLILPNADVQYVGNSEQQQLSATIADNMKESLSSMNIQHENLGLPQIST